MTTALPNESSGGVWIRIQHRFGARMMEWFYAGHVFLIGVALLIFPEIYTQPSAQGFAAVMSQVNFGLLMCVLGFARFSGLIVNGARRHITPWIRVVSAACGFVVFLLISFGFAASGIGGLWLAIFYKYDHSCGHSRPRDQSRDDPLELMRLYRQEKGCYGSSPRMRRTLH